MDFYSLLRLFENEAIYIDSHIAQKGEVIFLKFTKAFQWVITDAELFLGLEYDPSSQTDHMFRDKLRLLTDSCIVEDNVISIDELNSRMKKYESQLYLLPFLRYFDGLCSNEHRYRWDRIISFHLILMAFINKFGYDVQESSSEQFVEIAKSINNIQVLINLDNCLPKLGLQKETKHITSAIRSIQREQNN